MAVADRKRPVPITPGMVRAAAAMYGQNLTLRAIADELGCSPTSAGKAVVAGGGTIRNPGPRPTPVPADAVRAIVARHERDRASLADIADDLNVAGRDGWPVFTSSIVKRVLRDAGLQAHRPCRRTAAEGTRRGMA